MLLLLWPAAAAFALLFMAAVERVDVVMRTLRRVLIFSSELGACEPEFADGGFAVEAVREWALAL